MHGDVGARRELRREVLPESTLEGDANLLVMPNIDAANITYNLLKTAAGNTSRSADAAGRGEAGARPDASRRCAGSST